MMANSAYVSIDVLRQLIAYDPETGALTWNPRTPEMFEDCARGRCWKANSWNKRHRASIGVGGKRKNLGRYADFAEAVAAREAAEVRYGYHINTRRTANAGEAQA